MALQAGRPPRRRDQGDGMQRHLIAIALGALAGTGGVGRAAAQPAPDPTAPPAAPPAEPPPADPGTPDDAAPPTPPPSSPAPATPPPATAAVPTESDNDVGDQAISVALGAAIGGRVTPGGLRIAGQFLYQL